MKNNFFYTSRTLESSLKQAVKNTRDNSNLLVTMLRQELSGFSGKLSTSLKLDSALKFSPRPAQSELKLKVPMLKLDPETTNDSKVIEAHLRVRYNVKIEDILHLDLLKLLGPEDAVQKALRLTQPPIKAKPLTPGNLIADPQKQVGRFVSNWNDEATKYAATQHPLDTAPLKGTPNASTGIESALKSAAEKAATPQINELVDHLKTTYYDKNPVLYILLGVGISAAALGLTYADGRQWNDMSLFSQVNDTVFSVTDRIKVFGCSLNDGSHMKIPERNGSTRLGIGVDCIEEVSNWLKVGGDTSAVYLSPLSESVNGSRAPGSNPDRSIPDNGRRFHYQLLFKLEINFSGIPIR